MVVANNDGILSKQNIPVNTDNQELSLSGNTLSISNGNGVTLPNGSKWEENSNNEIFRNGRVGIDTETPQGQFHISSKRLDPNASLVNLVGGGTASILFESSRPAENAFDNSLITFISSPLNGWIQYEFPTSTVVNSYTMELSTDTLSASNISIFEESRPRSWYLEASNNQSDWIRLDSKENYNFVVLPAVQEKFYFYNPTAYKFYRITITENFGTPQFIISEISFYNANTLDADIIFNSGDVTLQKFSGNGQSIVTSNNAGILEASPLSEVGLTWDNQRRIGIRTENPAYFLHVSSGINTNIGPHGFFNVGGNSGTTNTPRNISIYAENFIACQEFVAFSDSRIKNIIGLSNAENDMELLQKIKITDYKYIDTVEYGNYTVKKVIAQELEEIYPQAVGNQVRRFIPNIYQLVNIDNGKINLRNNFQKGDLIRIIFEGSTKDFEIIEANEETIYIDYNKSAKAFAYGTEVNDFRTVDYDAITTLNISATQALIKKVLFQEQEIEKIKLESENYFRLLDAKIEDINTKIKKEVGY